MGQETISEMEVGNSEIPIWPADGGGRTRRMSLISAEPRWYLWLREENRQAIAAVRRDLLLLHQNGDLELFKGGNLPSNGTYVTALYDGKMIRGRVCPSKTIAEVQPAKKEKQKIFSVIDVDEGQIVKLPLNQLRVLPQEMRSLACQSVRCDIGMDCIEQFDWPPQINSMLLKALGKVFLLVENTSTRPGSIPTISASITVCDPSTGDTISIQAFLLGRFAMHLDLCSLEKFKPFPVGNQHLVEQKQESFQHPDFKIPSLPSNILPLPYHTSGMLPNVPQNFPNFPPGLHPFPNFIVPPGFMPDMMNSNSGPYPHPLVPPYSVGSSSISVTSSILNLVSQRPHSDSSSSSNQEVHASNTLYSSLSSRSISEYDSAESERSSVGIEMDNFSSRSSSDRNMKVQSPVHKLKSPEPKSETEKVLKKTVPYKDNETSQSSTDSVAITMEPVLTSSSCEEEVNCLKKLDSSSSSLSAEAPPFIPKFGRFAPRAEAPPFVPISKSAARNAKSPSLVSKNEGVVLSSKQCKADNLKGTKKEVSQLTSQPIKVSFASASQNFRLENKSSASKKETSSRSFAPDAPVRLASNEGDVNLKDTTRELVQPSLPSINMSGDIACLNNRLSPQKNAHITSDSQQPSCSSRSFPKGPDVELLQIVRKWKVGQIVPAVIARVWNPSCFEVNVVDEFCELFERMQEEMNDYYKSNKQVLSSKKQASEVCGHFCACFDADEGIWFRAEVDEWYIEDSVMPLKVWAVDYGGFSRVDLGCIQPLSSELACTSPRLVTLCSMRNIQPRSEEDIWPQVHLERVKELLPEGQEMYLRVDGEVSEEFIWPVSVFTNDSASLQSINEILVAEGCAYYVGCAPKKRNSSENNQVYEDVDNPMEEAYNIGGNNYEIDDEDACVAVSGWKPKEEQGICWFYNREGYCYKNYCELRHVRLNPDGHTIEKRELYTSSFEDIQDLLCAGKTIKIVITRILTVHHFMASIKFEKGSINSRETLASVIKNLNSTEMKRSLKTFSELPADGEIVLFRDSKTNMFYRGRIITSNPKDDDLYQVLNVDNGYIREVHLKDLRRVDPAFLHHPFQAVECWLADVAPTQSDREWTKSCNAVFAEIVANKKMSATIIRSSPWGIEINLMDKDGNDIALMLKEMNILKTCPMRHLPFPGSFQIPG